MVEKFFWADQIAEQIIKEKGNKMQRISSSHRSSKSQTKEYVCASGITPSGIVHIGNFREVITTELVVRALKDRGKKVRFIYSWDDFDRFRKVPTNVPKSFEKYIGMPVSDVPSPDGKGSYAEHFEKTFEKSLVKVGIKPEFIKQHLMNKKCVYASLIKKAIEKRKEIMDILNKYRKEPLKENWWPFAVYCEKCKKDSTKIISAERYFIEYECACGHKEKFDYRKKGIVSVKWRVDWPMRWKYEEVDFEPGGIDHSVEGGSYTTAKEISKKIYDWEPPIYQFYDWVTIKGIPLKDFHSSKGSVMTLDEVEEIYEPEVLRYLFASTKPRSGFEISFDNDVIKVYNEYDELELKYYSNKADNKEKRIYEMSQIKLSEKKPLRKNFRHLISFVQTGKLKGLNETSKKRAEKVRNWLKKYAGEDMKFIVQDKIKIKLSGSEKKAMIALKEFLNSGKKTEDEIFNGFYEICKSVGIENKDFFNTAYNIIIGKVRGPRLASLIIEIGQDKVVKLLGKIK